MSEKQRKRELHPHESIVRCLVHEHGRRCMRTAVREGMCEWHYREWEKKYLDPPGWRDAM